MNVKRAWLPKGRMVPLAAEIAVVVAVKVLLLLTLAHLFFAAPQAKHMRMEPGRVEAHLFKSR